MSSTTTASTTTAARTRTAASSCASSRGRAAGRARLDGLSAGPPAVRLRARLSAATHALKCRGLRPLRLRTRSGPSRSSCLSSGALLVLPRAGSATGLALAIGGTAGSLPYAVITTEITVAGVGSGVLRALTLEGLARARITISDAGPMR
jgi:hypothetical protein